ncbi:putative bifunctional diguanylate cyclase/phosphodiesterase [Vibrio tapetis]|uniref:Putative Diguanylate phosphodiesterase/Diguanylate cyclase n=1 Tax=Vibrio tapetis subsp. tapetis TaxID=1671868 RepID=A0A2N8ZCW6_9VIBR|nr:GGDEF domain-containing phosphodiesterase [Vibrio tapetis]SON49735.1 putative Diguanylate phosphodiesterase/Diguanylate cyclase [Vibrio tapetis subsp. tapetis]
MSTTAFVSIVNKMASRIRIPILLLTFTAVVLLSIGGYFLAMNEMRSNAVSRIDSIRLSTASAIYNFDFEQLDAISSTFRNDSVFSHLSIWSEGDLLSQTHDLLQPKTSLTWSEWDHTFPLDYVTAEGENINVGHIEAYVNPGYAFQIFALSVGAFLITIFIISLSLLYILRRTFHETIAYRLKSLSSQFSLVQDEHERLPEIHDQIIKERDEISELVDAYNLSSKHAARYIDAINENNDLLSTLAKKDPLTGNLNRQAFIECISNALDEGHQHGTIVRVNILNFSSINLKFGQKHGDNILKQVSQALHQCHCSESIICRLGGDDFFVFTPSNEKISSRETFHNITRAFSELNLAINIGVARHPTDASDPEVLIHYAEIALLEAKESKLDYSDYHLAFEERLKHKIYIDSRIEELLESRDFHVYYQPQVHIENNSIFGVESLLRLKKDDLSSPWEIITRAEDTGAILPLTFAIIEKIFEQWQEHIHQMPEDFSIAVNISPQSLAQINFVELLMQFSKQYQFPLSRLVLELTELTKVQQGQQVSHTLQRLRKLDVRLSLDDFGTGFSSMEYLLSYGFDELKIDRKFVMDLDKRPESVQIIKVISFLCQTLDMHAIAEGIETTNEEKKLKSLGITIGQGFLYSHAVPITRILEQIKDADSICVKS